MYRHLVILDLKLFRMYDLVLQMLEMSENYTPEISQYKVKYYSYWSFYVDFIGSIDDAVNLVVLKIESKW